MTISGLYVTKWRRRWLKVKRNGRERKTKKRRRRRRCRCRCRTASPDEILNPMNVKGFPGASGSFLTCPGTFQGNRFTSGRKQRNMPRSRQVVEVGARVERIVFRSPEDALRRAVPFFNLPVAPTLFRFYARKLLHSDNWISLFDTCWIFTNNDLNPRSFICFELSPTTRSTA